MAKSKFSVLQALLTCTIASTIINVSRLPAYSNQSDNSKIRFIEPTLKNKPSNRGAPTRRKGAGTRSGDCPDIKKKPELTALVPLMDMNETLNQQQTTDSSSDSSSPLALGLTTLEYPTFWFYVPYPSSQIKSLKFILLDENNNYATKEPILVNIPQKPGAIGIRLPKTEKPLEIDKYYSWYFELDCNPRISKNVIIKGSVKRISLEPYLQRQLEAATPRQRAAIYARAGIWQDAIAILGKLRRKKPQDTSLLVDWKNLLQSVDLGNIASEPITNCCSNTKEISRNKF